MPSHRCSFSLFPLVILLVLCLIIKILLIIAVQAEVLLLEDKKAVTEISGLEIDEPLRIESESLISCLEMKMWSCRTSGRAAKTDNITSIHPVSFLNHSLGKMTMESLDSVLVSDNHHITVSAKIL